MASRINVSDVNWRKDRITMEYVGEHRKTLENPESMTPVQLAEAITYCCDIKNPYTYALIERAKMQENLAKVMDPKDFSKLLDSAAKSFGIMLG